MQLLSRQRTGIEFAVHHDSPPEKGADGGSQPLALTQEGSRAGHHQRGDDHQDIQELHTLPPNTTSTSPFGFRIVQVLPPDLLIRTLMIFPPMFFSAGCTSTGAPASANNRPEKNGTVAG